MKKLIEIYFDKIRMLESHISTNKMFISEIEMMIIEQRISDFKTFIYYLENL